MITAINDDNDYEPGAKEDGKRKVTVSGELSPLTAGMTVKSASLTITDDDLAFGKVRLVLSKTRINESVGTGTKLLTSQT